MVQAEEVARPQGQAQAKSHHLQPQLHCQPNFGLPWKQRELYQIHRKYKSEPPLHPRTGDPAGQVADSQPPSYDQEAEEHTHS